MYKVKSGHLDQSAGMVGDLYALLPQGCSDYEVQCSIMLYVFRQLKWLAGDTSLLTIMMSAMDGRHLYEARCLITQGLVRFFRVDTLAELLGMPQPYRLARP